MERKNWPDRKFYERFINDECSAEEIDRLLIHVNEHGIDPVFDDLIDRLWERIQFLKPESSEQSEYLFHRIRVRAGIQEHQAEFSGNRSTLVIWKTPMRWAAVIAFMIAASVGLYWLRDSDQNNEKWQEVATALGERTMVTLPDETTVWLNAGSRLAYPHDFSGGERMVRLEGEAFFDVAHNERMPFVVKTKLMATRVLGTTFNVRAYLDEFDWQWQVAVFSGKVSVSAEAEEGKLSSVTLTKGEGVTFRNADRTLVKSGFTDINEYIGWREDIVTFNATPVALALRNLERHYGIPVRMESPPSGDCVITGTFEGKKLEDVLNVISLSLRGTYSKLDSGYVLKHIDCAE